MQITAHARKRMQQRSVRDIDLDLIMEFGIEFPDGLIVKDQDIEEEICRKKSEIHHLERLRGKAVIVKDGKLLTTYRPSRKQRKKFLRG